MVQLEQQPTLLVLLLGGILIVTTLVRSGLPRIGLPSLVGFLALGVLTRAADSTWHVLPDLSAQIFDFLGTVGVTFLLFRVGLESNLTGLLRQLRKASVIWGANIAASGLLGYVAAQCLLGLQPLPSLFVAIALTATSIAVPVAIWRETGSLDSRNGQLLVDVAEMDDISGVVLMALLFALTPVLHNGGQANPGSAIPQTVALFFLRLLAFGALCLLFSRYAERHVTGFFGRAGRPGLTLAVAAFGLIIAAVAGLIGFSVAIGAFFAGLIFSRDPEAVRVDTPFTLLYEFFAPFFFINVGWGIEPSALGGSLSLAGVLLAAAVLGKVVGTGTPALLFTGRTGSLLLGVSMVPRAEITLLIMHRGMALGGWAVSPELYSAMVLVSLSTVVLAPLALNRLLRRHPQQPSTDRGRRSYIADR
jgi:Kef-type K+ transport system membrane component KefB